MARKAIGAETHELRPADMPPIGLPRPRLRNGLVLESCLQLRRSTRQFATVGISLAELAQLLWAGQGITGLGGLRAAPSAGALYPIRTFVLAGKVRGLPAGLYRYDADEHYIRWIHAGDQRADLIKSGVDGCAERAAAWIILVADYRRPAREFHERAQRLVHIEAGHIGQNVCLQAVGLDLGTIGLGAFDTAALRHALKLAEHQEPVYIIAAGKRAGAVPLT